jgi:hypothetical protein
VCENRTMKLVDLFFKKERGGMRGNYGEGASG